MSRVTIQIIVMTAVTYLVRILPLTLIRKPIKNRFIRDFLYYVPYVTLAVMTFPAIVLATDHMASGIIALLAGLVTAYISGDLFIVAISCCAAVYLSGLIIH